MAALFSTFGIDWHLLLLQAVNFGILLVALTWLLYKPVRRVLEERRALIAKGVEDAREARAELAQVAAKRAATLSEAEQKAEGIVKAARAEAAGEREKLLAASEARAAQVERDAAARAAEASARTLRESEQEIARLAVLAAEKVLKEKA